MISTTGTTVSVGSWGVGGGSADYALHAITPKSILRDGSFAGSGIAHSTVFSIVADVVYDYQMIPLSEGHSEDVYVWESSNTSVGSIDSNGLVTFIGAGTTIVSLTVGDTTVQYTLTLANPLNEAKIATDYLAGSLGAHCCDAVDSLTADTPDLELYSTQDHATPTYVRSDTVWCSPLAQSLTAISPWNSQSTVRRGGTLISPMCLIFAAHYTPANGTLLRFIAVDGTVHTRTLQSSSRIGASDIQVGILDSALPPEITPMQVLPSNFAEYVPEHSDIQETIAALCLDQEEKAIIRDVSNLRITRLFAPQAGSARVAFTETPISGDSGNPCCLVINGALVLLGVWHRSTVADAVHAQIPAINLAMTQLGSNYQLTEVDLTDFTNYS